MAKSAKKVTIHFENGGHISIQLSLYLELIFFQLQSGQWAFVIITLLEAASQAVIRLPRLAILPTQPNFQKLSNQCSTTPAAFAASRAKFLHSRPIKPYLKG